jgi:hypothetical protein
MLMIMAVPRKVSISPRNKITDLRRGNRLNLPAPDKAYNPKTTKSKVIPSVMAGMSNDPSVMSCIIDGGAPKNRLISIPPKLSKMCSAPMPKQPQRRQSEQQPVSAHVTSVEVKQDLIR